MVVERDPWPSSQLNNGPRKINVINMLCVCFADVLNLKQSVLIRVNVRDMHKLVLVPGLKHFQQLGADILVHMPKGLKHQLVDLC